MSVCSGAGGVRMHDCMSEIKQHVGQKSADCSVPANVPHPHHGGFVEVETNLQHTHIQGGGDCMRGRYRATGMVIPDENAGKVSMGVLARVNGGWCGCKLAPRLVGHWIRCGCGVWVTVVHERTRCLSTSYAGIRVSELWHCEHTTRFRDWFRFRCCVLWRG